MDSLFRRTGNFLAQGSQATEFAVVFWMDFRS
jgi:hypothetical protein